MTPILPHNDQNDRNFDLYGRRMRLGVALIATVVLVASYSWNLAELATTWWNEPDYSHGFIVPIIALSIAWQRRGDLQNLKPSYLGLFLLALVLVIRAAFFELGEFWAETATILPAIAALTMTLGGWPLLRRVWPAVVFLVFMLTIPPKIDALLSQPLQRIAATCSGSLLRLSGLWTLNEGNVLDLGGERLEVATACNGLAMLMSLSGTVAAIIFLLPMAPWKRIGVLISALPIALACNVLRIVATAYCYETFGSVTGRKFAHDAAGWLMMPLALLLIGLELAWFSWLVRERKEAPIKPSPVLPALTGMPSTR